MEWEEELWPVMAIKKKQSQSQKETQALNLAYIEPCVTCSFGHDKLSLFSLVLFVKLMKYGLILLLAHT